MRSAAAAAVAAGEDSKSSRLSEFPLAQNSSLRNMVDESFLTLENNINDIIAFEEISAEKQATFRKARALFATPSERAMDRMPSERALGEIKRLSTQFETEDVSELQQELAKAANDYEVFGQNPFGIETTAKSATTSKRVSFTAPDSTSEEEDGEALRMAIKERLDFYETTLEEYSKEASRVSNVSIDSDTQKNLAEHESDNNDNEDAEQMKAAKETVYASAGKSTQQGGQKETEVPTIKKRKRGERFKNAIKRAVDWIRRRVEAFVASFTPKEKMIVVVTEMG